MPVSIAYMYSTVEDGCKYMEYLTMDKLEWAFVHVKSSHFRADNRFAGRYVHDRVRFLHRQLTLGDTRQAVFY